jgi:hypothetical protein
MRHLLDAFRAAYEGNVYLHRRSTTGDEIASRLYDDLLDLDESPKLVQGITSGRVVVNTRNVIQGKKGRRGDGTLGRLTPGQMPIRVATSPVLRGPVATLQIGAEVKIMATKMIAQIDRVMGDLEKQAVIFRRHNENAIAVGIVGVNHADAYTGHEGTRQFDAKVPPAREAEEVMRRIRETVTPHYNELLILGYRATNRPPYTFAWVNRAETERVYGSALLRISEEYERRF